MTKRAALRLNDQQRLDWLQEHIVDTIYFDNGAHIDVRGNSVREAIDRAALRAHGKDQKR